MFSPPEYDCDDLDESETMKTVQPTPAQKSKSGNGSIIGSTPNGEHVEQHCEHAVQFYEADAFLAKTVSAFIAEGLEAGEAGIVIATPDHRKAITKCLLDRGIDLKNLKAEGRYVSIDARETLSRFVIDGWPDDKLLEKVADELLRRATGRRGVRLFGEMVALLWAEGNLEGAIRLEELWNEHKQDRPLNVLCAYWIGGFSSPSNSDVFDRLCRAHSRVYPTEACTAPGQTDQDRLRAVAVLEQRARSLETELAESAHIEQSLRESDQRLQAIIDNSTSVIYLKDLDGKYTLSNRQFERLFGLTRERIIGKTDFDIFPEATALKFRENDRRVMATGEAIEIEEVAPQWDGPHTYISVKFPLRKTDGTIYATAGISTDVTDRSRASESRHRLAAIVESSEDAIISKNLNGVITTWNHGAERIFGYTAAEIIGKNVTVLIPPERQAEEPGILARLRKGERIDHYETIRRRKDGADVHVSLTVSPIKDGMGKIVGASKIARDITEQKRAALNQNVLFELACTVNRAVKLPEIYEAALTAICRTQNASRAAILLCDAKRKMRFKAWRGLSDEYRRSVEGHSPWRRDDSAPQPVCIEDVAKADLSENLRAVVAREGIRALAFLPITSEGRLLGKFMIYYDTPRHFTAEELQPTQTIINQVAFAIERQKAGEDLERTVNERTASLREAIAQMEEFSYSVSHDLRAPVRAMQCYAEVLSEDYGAQLDDTGKKYLDRIIDGGRRMDRLILDILTYSRLTRREIELHPVSLDELTRELVRQHFDLGAARGEIIVEGRLLNVLGHEPSLAQAISNLLNNAVKFVHPGTPSKVRIRTEQRNAEVRLWVEDNGIGIKPEYHHRLFSVFERIHPEKNYEGTGIGLAIVRKAAERMGGKVGVESDGVNGSRFWIQLRGASDL